MTTTNMFLNFGGKWDSTPLNCVSLMLLYGWEESSIALGRLGEMRREQIEFCRGLADGYRWKDRRL